MNVHNNIFYDVYQLGSSIYCIPDFNVSFYNNCSYTRSLLNPADKNIHSDPMFFMPTDSIGQLTNIVNYDWSLKSASQCINSGTSINLPVNNLVDFNGHPRFFDNLIDIGAYEFQGYKKPITDSLLVIFPNPTNDFIYVSIATNLTAAFILYDASLKIILNADIKDVTKIDLTALSKGIYFYQCKFSEGLNRNGKLVKF
jgi:hypothetical protein